MLYLEIHLRAADTRIPKLLQRYNTITSGTITHLKFVGINVCSYL